MNISTSPAFSGKMTYHYGPHNHKCKTSVQEDIERLSEIHDKIKYFVPPTTFSNAFSIEHVSNSDNEILTLTLRNKDGDLYTVVSNKGKITVVDGTFGSGSSGYTYEVDTSVNPVTKFLQGKLPEKFKQTLQDKYFELRFIMLEKIQQFQQMPLMAAKDAQQSKMIH